MIYLFRSQFFPSFQKIFKANFHRTKQSRSIFDPFKPKNVEQTLKKLQHEHDKGNKQVELPRDNTLVAYKKKLSIPLDARVIYINRFELAAMVITHSTKFAAIGMIGCLVWLLATTGLDEAKIRETLKLPDNTTSEEVYSTLMMTSFLLFMMVVVSFSIQRTMVLRIFHDEAKREFYCTQMTTFLRLRAEKFTKKDILYRFDPALSSSKTKSTLDFMTKNMGNFYINKRLKVIDVANFSTDNLKKLFDERVAMLIKLSK